MIRVSKIAHATYETPDLAQQTEYYTEIVGLTLAAQEKDAVYLASTVDHHSIVLRKGAQAQCTRIGFQIPPRPISTPSKSKSPATGSQLGAARIPSRRSRTCWY